jgi:hypothetical protein
MDGRIVKIYCKIMIDKCDIYQECDTLVSEYFGVPVIFTLLLFMIMRSFSD